MAFNFDKIINRFLLGEINEQNPSIFSYIQNLNEILSHLTPKTMREKRDLEIAKTHLNEIRKYSRKMSEKISLLEEQLKILEEKEEK